MNESQNRRIRRALTRVSEAAHQATRVGACLAGLGLLLCFFAKGDLLAAVSLSVIAFVAGGVRMTVASPSGDKHIEFDAGTVVTFASALALGPIGAVGPAAMAGLGSYLLVPSKREPFPAPFCTIARLTVQTAIAGLVFVKTGGFSAFPSEAASIPSVLAAAAAYALSEYILGARTVGRYGMAASLGLGYSLGASMRVLPPFTLLIPGLPICVVLLRLLRHSTPEPAAVEEHSESEAPKPLLIDPVTGLANQRYLDMFLRQEISRSERSGQPVSILLIDLDDFAKLDTGENEGTTDGCIAALGLAFKNMLRDYDLIARFKEDEFVIVLPETGAVAASETAWRLHWAYSGKILPLRAQFSVGVATFPEYGASVDDLMSSAHHALNRAKFSGKNTVRSCHELAKAS